MKLNEQYLLIKNIKKNILGTIKINIFIIKDNWKESNDEAIKDDDLITIEGEKDNGDPVIIEKSGNKYLKSIILFSISILYFSLILLPVLLKKLKKKYRKNDKI